jgi:hypothetical protein
MSAKTKVRLDRLRKVVQALREAPRAQKSKFTMKCYVFVCGTPACALGHYAARRDLQRSFKLDDRGVKTSAGARLGSPAEERPIHDHFGITPEQADELFGMSGCDAAETPIQAARYIERFIKLIEKENAK